MPTPVAHAIAGAGVYLASSRGRPLDGTLFLSSVAAACLADADFVLNFLTGDNYHHYFTHSLAFTALVCLIAYAATRMARRPRPSADACVLGLAYLSHVFLDLFSKDTLAPYGIELLWPFSDRFVISPVSLFDDVWRGTLAKLLSAHNGIAVAREVLIVGPVVAALALWRFRPTAQREYS